MESAIIHLRLLKQKKRNLIAFYNTSYAFTFCRSIKTENRKTFLIEIYNSNLNRTF